jgi:3-hydroxybutyryl-CoA dehydrogenase
MTINNVTIAGAGTLGSQIAWQTAFHGFEVIVYDAFEKGLEAGKEFHKQYAELFVATRGATAEQIEQTMARLSYTTDLAKAVENADLINESIPEIIEIKKNFYQSLAKVAPEKTIFTTNSSTLTPSSLAEASGRPSKFLALHFAVGVWDRNIGEVMGHEKTDPTIFNQVTEFAKAIGMVPIPIHKEQPGYVLNSLIVPWLATALDLVVKGVADPETVDKTWTICVGSPLGPFAILDQVGLETAYNIYKMWGEQLNDQAALDRATYLKNNFVDQNKLGVKTGQGFYSYPNP